FHCIIARCRVQAVNYDAVKIANALRVRCKITAGKGDKVISGVTADISDISAPDGSLMVQTI
ncbi:TPA: hypothetical protein ACF26P_005264, partial [Klebsiella quasipneumoniae subsp. similipneumoniae]